MTDHNSAISLFLKHTPEALDGLFDLCISSHCGYEQINGKVFCDFFLFYPPKGTSSTISTGELTFPQILINQGKTHFLAHPLFETFIKVITASFMNQFDVLPILILCS